MDFCRPKCLFRRTFIGDFEGLSLPTGESAENLTEKIKEKLHDIKDENISPEDELRLIQLMKMRNNLI